MSDVGADGKSTQTKWDDQKMRNEIGISADVDRHKEGGEAAKRSNRALNDIGDFIHKNTPECRSPYLLCKGTQSGLLHQPDTAPPRYA
jgi:hypothetical protein